MKTTSPEKTNPGLSLPTLKTDDPSPRNGGRSELGETPVQGSCISIAQGLLFGLHPVGLSERISCMVSIYSMQYNQHASIHS